jgi:hypothetical protein
VASPLARARATREAVSALNIDIYEPLTEHPEAVYSTPELEAILRDGMVGQRFDAPIKTRGKLAKQAVAEALGYPVPAALRRTHPRFPGQDLDVYVQQSNNLQVWNAEISPSRRYAVLRVDDKNEVVAVRVVEGVELAKFDSTGTLTSKYQAKRLAVRTGSALVSPRDTEAFISELAPVPHLGVGVLSRLLPASPPRRGEVLGVSALHEVLLGLVGRVLVYSPSERQRGEQLHRAACEVLGLGGYSDTGQFPDIVCQALEVKLQLAGTIDLGLVTPDSREPALALSPRLRHRDARYLVAYALHEGGVFEIDHLVTTTGADFFDEFQRFGGLVQNRKLQLHLPDDFFQPE